MSSQVDNASQALDRLAELVDSLYDRKPIENEYRDALATVRQRLAEQDTEIQRLREERDEKGCAYGEEALAHNETLERAEAAEAENRRLRGGLRDFAEHGTRFDTNPTVRWPTSEINAWWVKRATEMDRGVREKARALLAGSEAEPDKGGAK